MPHLVCHMHNSRSMVLQNGDVVHRNGKACASRIVWWGDREFVSFDVPSVDDLSSSYSYLPAASKATMFSREKMAESVKAFGEGLQKATEEFKKLGSIISEGAKQISVVLPNIMMPGEYRVIQTSESDPMAGLTIEKVPPVNLMTGERELLQAIFGKLEDVARDTTIGTAHITSTSEGVGGITADIVLIDEVASSDPKFGDAEFNQFKYVDNLDKPLAWEEEYFKQYGSAAETREQALERHKYYGGAKVITDDAPYDERQNKVGLVKSLRAQGFSFVEIAELTGMLESTVRHFLKSD